MARAKGIMAYGTEEDRLKLAALSKVLGKSGSELLIEMIRQKYAETIGVLDPKRII